MAFKFAPATSKTLFESSSNLTVMDTQFSLQQTPLQHSQNIPRERFCSFQVFVAVGTSKNGAADVSLTWKVVRR